MSSGLVTLSTPNLVNGVSQQPASIRLVTQCKEQLNAIPSSVEGLKKRPPTAHISKVSTGVPSTAMCHLINRDENEQYFVMLYNGKFTVVDLDGNPKSVTMASGTSGYVNTQYPNKTIKAMTIGDYTFVLNKGVNVSMSSTLSTTPNPQALISAKVGNYGQTYKVIINNTTVASYTTSTTDVSTLSTSHIAKKLLDDMLTNMSGAVRNWQPNTAYKVGDLVCYNGNAFRALGNGTSGTGGAIAGKADGTIWWYQISTHTWMLTLSNNTIHIIRRDKANFSISIEDGYAGKGLLCVKDTVQSFSNLPAQAPDGYKVMIAGANASVVDNYYVEFKAYTEGVFGDGVWQEVVGNDLAYKVDASTMPHALVRQSDGSFIFKELDWDDRKCGDDDTAPLPSFFGNTIEHVFLYKNRLGFLSGSSVCFSRAGNLFNFFPTTVTTVLDSDPIDVTSSSGDISNLRYAVHYNKQLLILADQAQFILSAAASSSGSLLSPKTVSLVQTTQYSVDKCTPIATGKSVFFVTKRGEYSGIREYFVTDGTVSNVAAEGADAMDITAHVPQYINGSVTKLAASANEDLLFVLTDTEYTSLYVYKSLWQGSEKLQSAWSKFTFTGSNLRILGMGVIQSDLYLMIRRADGVYLEVMRLEPARTDPHLEYAVPIDQKINETHTTMTYDADTDLTTYTLPYAADNGTLVVLTRPTADGDIVREITPYSASNTIVKLSGDTRSSPLYFGFQYQMKYVFNKQYMRDSNKLPILGGRLQLRNVTFNVQNTGYLKVGVTNSGRDTKYTVYTPPTIGLLNSHTDTNYLRNGTVKVSLMGNAAECEVSIYNSTHHPTAVLSAEWEGMYTNRDTRS